MATSDKQTEDFEKKFKKDLRKTRKSFLNLLDELSEMGVSIEVEGIKVSYEGQTMYETSGKLNVSAFAKMTKRFSKIKKWF